QHSVSADFSTFVFCFFFQAEDGIRDFHVTGVQTCALPILPNALCPTEYTARPLICPTRRPSVSIIIVPSMILSSIFSFHIELRRSEERRVGKESRAGWSPYQTNKKKAATS